MSRHLSFPQLLILLIASRLAALLLYRPGGLIAPLELPYAAFTWLPLTDPLWRQLAGGLILLPFEAATLYAIAWLMRRAGQPKEAIPRAFWWAVSPLSLWAYLTGIAPVVAVIGLGLFALLRQGRRTWLMAAFFLVFAIVSEGAKVNYTAPLLVLIILLVDDPASRSVLFTWGALVGGVVAGLTGVAATIQPWFNAVLWLAALPAVVELALMLIPIMGFRERWGQWLWRGALGATAIVSVITIFIILPPQVRAGRLETSPLTPALTEMASAHDGWFISDNHDLWEQSVGLGVGQLEARVVTPRNLESLRTTLRATTTPIWLLQSNREGADGVITPLVTGFFVGEVTPLADGTLLCRFVSDASLPAAPLPQNATFTDGVTLTTAQLPASTQAGTLLPIELTWTGDLGNATLFLHLLDANGTLVAQRDAAPTAAPDRHALTLPATLAPGMYTLNAGRYDPATLQRIPLSQGGDTMTLATLEVVD